MADDVDEENCHRRIQYDLEDRVDSHEDGAVLVIAASYFSPDQDLRFARQ